MIELVISRSTPAFTETSELSLEYKINPHSTSIAQSIKHTISNENIVIEAIEKLVSTVSINGDPKFDLFKKAAGELTNVLLPKEITNIINSITEGEKIKLQLEDGLLYIPWELLWLNDYFFGIKYLIIRQIITEDIVLFNNYESKSKNIDITITSPFDDDDANDFANEWMKLQMHFENYKNVNIQIRLVNKPEFIRLFRKNDVIHYIGHSTYNEEMPEKSGLKFKDGILNTDDIKYRIDGGTSFPKLIFVNSCESARYNNKFQKSIVKSFFIKGIKNFIGTLFDIETKKASAFSLKFYDLLLKGISIDESFQLTKKYFYNKNNYVWINYVLYGIPNYKLHHSKYNVLKFLNRFNKIKKILILTIISALIIWSFFYAKIIFNSYIVYNKLNTILVENSIRQADNPIYSTIKEKVSSKRKDLFSSYKSKNFVEVKNYFKAIEAYLEATKIMKKDYFNQTVKDDLSDKEITIAEGIINEGLNYNHEEGLLYYRLASIEAEKNNYDTTLSLYEKAISYYNNPAFYNTAGNFLISINRLYSAERVFKMALNLKPDYANPINNLALINYEFGKYRASLNYIEKYRELYPENHHEYLLKGKIFEHFNKDRALDFWYSMKNLIPDNWKLLFYIGENYKNRNDFESAVPYYLKSKKIIESEKIYTEKKYYLLLSSLSSIYQKQEKYEMIFDIWVNIPNIYKKNPYINNGIFYNKGMVYYNFKNFEKAKFNLLKYHEAENLSKEENKKFLYNTYKMLGNIFYENKEYNNTIIYYEKAIKFNRDDFNILNKLGDIYWQKGNITNAIDSYFKSVRTPKNSELVTTIKNIIKLHDEHPDKFSSRNKFTVKKLKQNLETITNVFECMEKQDYKGAETLLVEAIRNYRVGRFVVNFYLLFHVYMKQNDYKNANRIYHNNDRPIRQYLMNMINLDRHYPELKEYIIEQNKLNLHNYYRGR